MRKVQIFCVLLISSLFLMGCASTGNFYVDQDPDQDFSGYETFAWISEKPMTVVGDHTVSPLAERRFMDAIISTLSGKGYQLVENPASADFAVSFTVGARDQVKTRTHLQSTPAFDPWLYRGNWRWGRGYYDYYFPQFREVTTHHNYTEGTLSIDLFDVARKSPVWHGSANKNLSKRELDSGTAGIEEAVATLLDGFPR